MAHAPNHDPYFLIRPTSPNAHRPSYADPLLDDASSTDQWMHDPDEGFDDFEDLDGDIPYSAPQDESFPHAGFSWFHTCLMTRPCKSRR